MTAAAQSPGADPPTGRPLRTPPGINTSAAVQAVFHELHPQFDGHLPTSMVRDYVIQAAADLQGSISREALPEMVIRLAAVRLEHQLRLQPAEGGHHPHPTEPSSADDRAPFSDRLESPFSLLR